MRTVDILSAAQSFLSDKSNWGTGSLVEFNEETQKNCFCALGSVLKAGGFLTGRPHPYRIGRLFFSAPKGVTVDSIHGIGGLVGETGEYVSPVAFGRLSKRFLTKLAEEHGLHAAQTKNAIRYLQEAVQKLTGGTQLIWKANDSRGYDFIMKAFSLAIRNAKRRHITGDRKKASVQASA